jgi:alkylated DNA repair dioxygenase AlkB
VNGDLFVTDEVLERIPMPDAEVYYQARLALDAPTDDVMHTLIASVPWRAEEITLWGKTFLQPRLSAWYGDIGAHYTYSGIKLTPLPWSELLLRIKSRVEAAAKISFNSVLLNYYRDNRDSMGFHSDDEAELGRQPVIASVSLGEERTFILKHKENRTLKPIRIDLASGSLLLMMGDTQHNWRHGIDKEVRSCGPRINLTFRRICP